MKIDILGIKVDKIRQEEVLQKIGEWLFKKEKKPAFAKASAGKHYIVTPNPEFVMWAQHDEEFKDILNQADLAIPDGIGLLWAAKFLKLKVKSQKLKVVEVPWQMLYTGLSLIFYPRYCRTVLSERVTGTDLVWKIAKLAEQKNCSIYLLGARGNIAQLAALKLKQCFPNLIIVGTFAGSPKPETDEKLQAIINHTKPDILLVAYGHPKQEKWIERNLSKLVSVKVALGVGGAFDFIAGKAKRAPQFFRKFGLEWLWRFFVEPLRAGRIFTATFRFVRAIFRHKLQINL